MLIVFVVANLITLSGYSILQGIHIALTDTGDIFNYGLPMHFTGLHAVLFAAVTGSLFRVVFEWYKTMPATSDK
jgi:hypothetical protein